MDLDSPDKGLEMMGDVQENDGANSITKLDLNISVNKEGAEIYRFESREGDDRVQVNLNQQGQHGSPSLPADFEFERSQSYCTKSSSPVQTDLDHDYMGRRTYEGEGLQSPSNDSLYQGKMGLVHGSDNTKSLSPVETETFHSEMETTGSNDYCLKPLSTVDENNEGVCLEVGSDLYRTAFTLIDEQGKDNSIKFPENVPYEKSACKQIEGKDTDISSPRTQHNRGEISNEDFNHVEELPADNGKLEVPRSDQQSHRRGSERSMSPMGQISVSPEISPYSQQSPGHKPYSSTHSVQDVPYSPETSKLKQSAPERSGHDSKRVLRDNTISPTRRVSTSPRRRSRHDSHRRDDSSQKHISKSPRRHYSPENGQRHDRSASRSPVRRKDSSSGYRRDHYNRSRSRSPNAKDRDRRSPRRRYSPRRISPASGYHSHHRFPRRRPWSPPPNRSTGVGRPGNSLFVAGFSFVTTERDLERKFSRFGHVRDVRIVRDKRSGDSRGFGFLTLERDEDADAAIRALDQTEWNGRIVLVEKSKTSGR